MLTNISVWLVLPFMAAVSSQLVLHNSLLKILHSSLTNTFISLGPIVAFESLFVISMVCLNNFNNLFLSQEAHKKVILRPEERSYKRLLFVYLLVVGTLVLFFNDIVVYGIPTSALVLVLQVFYTLALIVIHPYKQSLRVHTITLLINQCLYIVFLVVVNFINLIKDMDELLIIMLGYFLTGCCGLLVLLTFIRLYFELRYGEALERKIQKEREEEEELERKLKEEKLEQMKKQLESEAKKKQNAKEVERAKNQYLYENQLKE